MTNLYASGAQRALVISGLREMAAFLKGNLDVPAPPSIAFHVFPPTGLTDAEAREEIDAIAARIGTKTSESAGGHYIASIRFGLVEYSAVAIPRAARDGR